MGILGPLFSSALPTERWQWSTGIVGFQRRLSIRHDVRFGSKADLNGDPKKRPLSGVKRTFGSINRHAWGNLRKRLSSGGIRRQPIGSASTPYNRRACTFCPCCSRPDSPCRPTFNCLNRGWGTCRHRSRTARWRSATCRFPCWWRNCRLRGGCSFPCTASGRRQRTPVQR